MKTNLINSFKVMSILFLLASFTVSCKYQEIVDIDYPEGVLYLPAAIKGVYTIDALTQKMLANPTPGSPSRYQINRETNRFEIPLGVFRSGMNPGGKISVNIATNQDTVSALIASGTLEDTEILPGDKYTISHRSLEMLSGQQNADFIVSVDFGFIKQQAPQKYAFAISISSTEQQSNPKFNTVVVLIDTKILIQEALFSFQVDAMDKKKISFKSESKYALTYAWDFGDNTSSNEENPVHIYEIAGDYEVGLTVTGLYGDENNIKKQVQIAH